MNQLGRESRELVDAARAGDDPSPEDRARVRRRLMQLGVGAAVTTVASATAAAVAASSGTGAAAGSAMTGGAVGAAGAAVGGGTIAPAAMSSVGLLVFKVVAAVAVVGGVSVAGAKGVAVYRAHHGAGVAPESAVVAARERHGIPRADTPSTVNPPPPSQETEPAGTPAPAPPSTGASSVTLAPPAAVSGDHRGPDARPGDRVRTESRILAQAEHAQSSGDAYTALALVDEHAASFPEGVLVPERETTRILALCDLGRIDEATALARRFLKKWPGVTSADRVRGSCARLP